MAGVRNEGDFQCTIERQATWGTPISTAPIGLNTVDLKITHDGDRHIVPVDRGIRFNHEDDRFVDTASTFPVCSFSAPFTHGMMKTVLPGLLQKATNWTVSGATVFYPAAPADLPTPRAITGTAGGYAYTIGRRSPTASQGERISDAICRRLKISLHPTNNNGLLWGEWEFIGTTYSHSVDLAPDASPDPTQDPLTATTGRLAWANLADVIVDGGADLLTDFVSFELDMTFGAKFAGDTPRGEVLFPRFEATLTATFGQNTQTQAYEALMRSQAISTGHTIIFKWGDGTVSSAGELNLTFHGNVETFDDSDRSEGETHKITLSGEQGAAGVTESPVYFSTYY